MGGSLILNTFVAGRPAPKGSMDFMPSGYAKQNNRNSEPWEMAVRDHCRPLVADCPGRPDVWVPRDCYPYDGPVSVHLSFGFLRPKRPDPVAALWPCNRGTGDIDKLTRNVHDGLEKAGVFTDDARVCVASQTSRWVDATSEVGVEISVWTL